MAGQREHSQVRPAQSQDRMVPVWQAGLPGATGQQLLTQLQ